MIQKITQLSKKIMILTCFLITSLIVAQEPGVPTGLEITSSNANEFTLTWDADALATEGFNVAIVGSDGSDIWIEWGYTGGTSYTYSGTYGSGASEITIVDGNEYTVKLQALPDTDWNAYAAKTFTLNGSVPEEPDVPTGLQITSNNANEFTLTWDSDVLATGGFNVGIVGADGSDIWVEWGYTAGNSYTFSGTYGSGVSEITIVDGNEYTVKLQALPDADWNAYASTSTGTLSTNKYNEIELNMYPNPVETTLQVRLKNSLQEDVTLSVFNIMGQLVKVSNKTSISVADLDAGVYIISIENNKGQKTTKKFIKS